jgi:ferredoxin, 2Fe-2S
MPQVTFIVDGNEKQVQAREGQSLMRAAVENDIEGVIAECGGEMSCATCHVWLQGDRAGAVPEKSLDEEDMLDVVEHLQPESRLGCQITLTSELDGLRACIPGE